MPVSVTVQAAIDTQDLPAGVTFVLAGTGADQAEALSQLGLAMLAALLLVLLVMVAVFRRFLGLLVWLVSVPFAPTGAHRWGCSSQTRRRACRQ